MKSIFSFACIALITTVFVVFSCQKPDADNDTPPDNVPPTDTTTHTNPGKPIEYVNITITGQVLDLNRKPVSGTVVKAGTATTTSGLNGEYILNNVRVDKNAAFIKAEKDGFFVGSHTMLANDGAVYHVTITLLGKREDGKINGATGGTVTVPYACSLDFPANCFINTADNKAYTGSVSVSTYAGDQMLFDYDEIMPGAWRGIDTAGREKGLVQYALAGMEFNGAGGEKLQLAPGKTATLSVPINFFQLRLALAPPTVTLWSFNDTTGLWKQEGTATKQGNNYVATINHAANWACAAPIDLIEVKGTFKEQNGSSLYPGKILLRSTADSTSYFRDFTDSTGLVTTKIPANTKLQVFAFNSCPSNVYTGTAGPLTASGNLGTINVINPAQDVVTITGTVVNCNGAPVTNGYVDISFTANYRAPIINGRFTYSFKNCENRYIYSAGITAHDLSNNQEGNRFLIPISSTTVNAGQISACDKSIKNYVTYSQNGVTTTFSTPADSIGFATYGYVCAIWAMRRPLGGDRIDLSFTVSNSTGLGVAPVGSMSIKSSQGYKTYSPVGTINANIYQYYPTGGAFIGSFSGNFTDDATNNSVPFNVLFNTNR